MFSLIITIISIALVAALALATLYYGGTVFMAGSSRAQATQYISQGQQVLGAAELFKANTGDWPDTMQALVTGGYLKSVPVAGVLLSPAYAADAATPWAMARPGRPVYVLDGLEPGICESVNDINFKVPGVLTKLRASWASQCYSPTPGDYKVVVTKDEASLIDAFPEEVTHEELPEPGSAKWARSPRSGPVVVAPVPIKATLSNTNLAYTPRTRTLPLGVTNNTAEPLVFNRPPLVSGSSAFTSTTDCPVILAPGASCTTTVDFDPWTEPLYGGSLVLDTTSGVTEVPLSGPGLPKAAVPLLSATEVTFPAAKPGEPTSTAIQLTNNDNVT